jgi:hypothetical protein
VAELYRHTQQSMAFTLEKPLADGTRPCATLVNMKTEGLVSISVPIGELGENHCCFHNPSAVHSVFATVPLLAQAYHEIDVMGK